MTGMKGRNRLGDARAVFEEPAGVFGATAAGRTRHATSCGTPTLRAARQASTRQAHHSALGAGTQRVHEDGRRSTFGVLELALCSPLRWAVQGSNLRPWD
jgi:hypothetical protein